IVFIVFIFFTDNHLNRLRFSVVCGRFRRKRKVRMTTSAFSGSTWEQLTSAKLKSRTHGD
ncbi:hypothetical protein, partial [Vibrio harveyi]|uniref:hypothetical protein n=1 Tax=Vibrio harveyi TaxID=669 RepID=UPI001F31422B